MIAKIVRARRRKSELLAVVRITIAAAILNGVCTGVASAYVGESFMEIPGIAGDWRGQHYKNAVKFNAHYWKSNEGGSFSRGIVFRHPKMFFSGPTAPRTGASALVVSVDKRSPALRKLMDACLKQTKIPELTYAESSVLARGPRELGPRPVDVPEYFEYKLKEVQFSECPVVADAPEQAIVVSFNDIEWLNYHEAGEGKAVKLERAELPPVKSSGKTESFVVTWVGVAHDVSADQCSSVTAKPTEDDYYALVSTAEAEKERTALASKGGVHYDNGQFERRGPNKINACLLPGVVRDPGFSAPQSKLARGFNLDGDNGTRGAPGTCKHQNYVSSDGRIGIDNQLYTVQGCVPGYQGHKGFLMQYSNEQRRNGLLAVLIQISGIDDAKNDDSVDVTVLYSKDPMAKSASGAQILPDYTFRLTEDPEYTHYVRRLHGRIVNGIVVTEPVKQLQMNLGIDVELTLYEANMRLEIAADGTLKGIFGGYQDWRKVMQVNSNSITESNYGFQCPGIYNALRRAADGLKDPVSGDCNGISSAYDIEGVPAFIPPEEVKSAVAVETDIRKAP